MRLLKVIPARLSGKAIRAAAHASLFFRQFSMFHVEHSVFRCITIAPEYVRFRMLNRGDKHLTTQTLKLMRQHDSMTHIQFGVDVVQKERHLFAEITQHFPLGYFHQNDQRLLLPPGKGFCHWPTAKLKSDIRSIRTVQRVAHPAFLFTMARQYFNQRTGPIPAWMKLKFQAIRPASVQLLKYRIERHFELPENLLPDITQGFRQGAELIVPNPQQGFVQSTISERLIPL